jgi:YgiT-type zinc finger domain-containing protein
MKLSQCPVCDSKAIHQEMGAIVRKVHGKKITIPDVMYWICSRCKEKVFPATSVRKMGEFLKKKAA